MNPINRSPANPVSGTDADEVWFPIRVTSVPAVGQYLFQEVWLQDGGLQIADRIGGRSNTATDPAYPIDGSTFAVTAAGSPVQAFARRAPGCGGGNWELIAPGGGPDATKTTRGWVSATTQTFGGVKTFYSGIRIGDGTVGSGDTISFSTFANPSTGGFIKSDNGITIGTQGGVFLLIATAYSIADGTGTYAGLTTTFLTGDGRIATFHGGILTGLA